MDWLSAAFLMPSALQAVVVIALICAVGLSLGNLHIKGVSLGVAFVFFTGIMAGHIFGKIGLKMDPQMITYAESSGLILFVYALGLQVGPAFISSFRKGGAQLNLLALVVLLLGTLMAMAFVPLTGVHLPDIMGILCGATTNTPALGAAQQTLKEIGQPSTGAALGCAVTYPLGVIGVIFAIMLVRYVLLRHCAEEEDPKNTEDEPFIASFDVCNPAVFDKPLHDVTELNDSKFVVSRLWRNGQVILPDADTVLKGGDRILVIASHKYIKQLTFFFGKLDRTDWNKNDVDWNAIDHDLVSQRIVITRHEINGKRLGALHLRNRFGINVSRVYRSDVQLVATPDLVLRMGDRVTVIGNKESVAKVAKEMGNTVHHLDEPNLVSIFIGIVLGLVLGAIPFSIPGISVPVRLGIAGGPIIVGILIGAYGPRFHMVTYTTSSANQMLRALGLSIYLACLGIDAGGQFFATVMRPEGALWIALGFLITVVPVVIVAIICLKVAKLDLATTSGMLCGSMANPMALIYVNDTMRADKASVAYTTVYPLCMFVRVISVQLIIMGLGVL